MTINLLAPKFISGALQPVGTRLSLDLSLEASLVNMGAAVYEGKNPHVSIALNQNAPTKTAIIGGSHALREVYGGSTEIKATAPPLGGVRWAQAFGLELEIVAFAGEGGRHISEVLEKMDSEAMQYGPELVIIYTDCVGNFLALNNGSETVIAAARTAMSYLRQILDRCYIRNAQAWVINLPPNANCLSTFDTSANLTTSKEMQKWNRILREEARVDRRFLLIEADDYCVDTNAAGGRFTTTTSAGATGAAVANSAAYTHDDTHGQPRKYIELGLRIVEASASTRFAARTWHFPQSNSDNYDRLINPTNSGSLAATAPVTGFIGSSNTLTATGLSAGTVVASKRRRRGRGVAGECVKVVCTSVAGVTDITYTFVATAFTAESLADFQAGDDLYAIVEVMLLARPTNLRGFKPVLNYLGATQPHTGFNTVSSGTSAPLADVGPWLPLGRWMYMHTPIAPMPAGVTNFNIALSATKGNDTGVDGGNISAQYLIGRARIFKAGSTPPIGTALVLP